MSTTRLTPRTPLLTLCQQATTGGPANAALATGRLLERLRPAVERQVAPLWAGLRPERRLPLPELVELVLVDVGASLCACRTESETHFLAWVSATVHRSVLVHHGRLPLTALAPCGRPPMAACAVGADVRPAQEAA